MNFGLAPLSVRRDIAMLGVIHRAVIGEGPKQFHSLFLPETTASRAIPRRRRHGRQLQDPYSQLHRDYLNRSLLGYIWIYNWLPEQIVASASVKTFQ